MQARGKPEVGCVLRVRVQPRASREGAHLDSAGRLCVALNAPPVDGAANAALCSFLARQFRLSKSSVTVTAGEKSRDKTLRLAHVAEEEVQKFLDALKGA